MLPECSAFVNIFKFLKDVFFGLFGVLRKKKIAIEITDWEKECGRRGMKRKGYFVVCNVKNKTSDHIEIIDLKPNHGRLSFQNDIKKERYKKFVFNPLNLYQEGHVRSFARRDL